MSVRSLWLAALGRVRRAPALVVILWLASLAITVPPAFAIYSAINTHLDSSLEADTAADGMNYDWMQEFRAQAGPLGRTLRPEVIGFAAVLDNTSALADATLRPPGVVLGSVTFVLLVWFVSPGAIAKLATDRSADSGTFLYYCGAFGFRMLRLGIFALAAYIVLFGSLHAWLFDDVFESVTRNLTVERTAFFIRLALYIVFFAILALVNLAIDLAKVRMVVEDRRSVLGAVSAAVRFIRANPRVTIGAYAMNVLAFVVVLAVYAAVAPGAGSAGISMWAGFVVGQLYVLARLVVKLAFWASEIVALQTRFRCPRFLRAARAA